MFYRGCEPGAEMSSELQDLVHGLENSLGFLDHYQKGIHLQTVAAV